MNQLVLILGVLLFSGIGLNTYLGLDLEVKNAEIKALRSEITLQENSISALKITLEKQNKAIEKIQMDAEAAQKLILKDQERLSQRLKDIDFNASSCESKIEEIQKALSLFYGTNYEDQL